MFETFSHYLSYGATDQQTVRELTGAYDGLVVPGTVAAFQRQGTGGFVLALSATQAAVKYVIDPRFPLFQQPLLQPKKSHHALAELLGFPQLVSTNQPQPSDFAVDTIDTIAQNWVQFNASYVEENSKFEKYARRLRERVEVAGARAPSFILAPYFIVHDSSDPWWQVSNQLFLATAANSPSPVPCIRVVAVDQTGGLGELLVEVDDRHLVVWVSGLQELETAPNTLAEYAIAVGQASALGKSVFALYGGFFSVLLSGFGLTGSAHGIGYGESRSWQELPQSGPPPARYYLPQLHRYVSQELAYQLWLSDRTLAECNCDECQGEPPISLEYHALMRHSVLCRQEEIRRWAGWSPTEMADRLSNEYDAFLDVMDRARLAPFFQRSTARLADHIPRWAGALRLAVGQ